MKTFERLIEYLLISLLGLMTLVSFYQVVGRYVLQKAPYWSEPLTLTLLNYMVFLGVPILLWYSEHVSFDYFINKTPKPLLNIILFTKQIILTFFGIVMIYYSWQLLISVKDHQVPTLGLSQSINYIPVVFSGIAICLISIYKCVQCLTPSRIKT